MSRAAVGTQDLILDAAERRVQGLGFNGFSYADIADELSVSTATIHYHFTTKSELGASLLTRYTACFLDALARISGSGAPARQQLHDYAGLFEAVLAQGRICLCGMLAAEYSTLPGVMRERVGAFFAANQKWLTAVLERGRASGELAFGGDPWERAFALISGLEGGMLVARTAGGVAAFRASARVLLDGICAPAATGMETAARSR